MAERTDEFACTASYAFFGFNRKLFHVFVWLKAISPPYKNEIDVFQKNYKTECFFMVIRGNDCLLHFGIWTNIILSGFKSINSVEKA